MEENGSAENQTRAADILVTSKIINILFPLNYAGYSETYSPTSMILF